MNIRGQRGPRLALAAVVAVVTVAVAVGCSRTVTIDEWSGRADAVCRKAQEDFDANPPPDGPLPGERLRASAARTRTAVDRLRDLPEPDSRQVAARDYLRSLERRVDLLELYAADLDRTPANDPAPPVDKLTEATNEAVTRAAALGLVHCGAGVDVSLPGATTTTSGPSVSAPVPTAVGGQPEDEENTIDEAG